MGRNEPLWWHLCGEVTMVNGPGNRMISLKTADLRGGKATMHASMEKNQ